MVNRSRKRHVAISFRDRGAVTGRVTQSLDESKEDVV
jgi:hypothetical protein